MKVGHLELFVSNIENSRRFYEEILGFKVETVMAEGRLVWLGLEGFTLLLRLSDGQPNDKPMRSSQFDLVFYDEDPVSRLETLKARGLEVLGNDSGCPTFCDPDGNWFQLVNSCGEFNSMA